MSKRAKKIVFIVIASIVVITLAVSLVRWTNSIESRKRANELKKALSDVIDNYGERGLLEMAGVPVNNIFYGDSGITLFEGDTASWTYSADELINISVFEKCSPAVVHIKTVVDNSVSDFLDVSYENGVGSGFFISSDGYIVTNEHVIEGASFVTVTTADGSMYDADIVGTDDENDIAVLKVTDKEKQFTFLEFEDSENLVVGQKVLAIGNPFGYDRSMSDGIISGLSRPIRDDKGQILLGMIQTNCAINPGNSGGPLLNSQGHVIGLCTAIYSSTGTNQGMNFATASNTIYASAQDIIKYGKVNRGWLDIVPVQLSQTIVDYAKLKISNGILVSQTVPLGEAEKAGIKGGSTQVKYGSSIIYLGGDIITSINKYDVSEYGDVFTALSNTRPGDKVPVTVYRDGKTVELKVVLVERTSENVSWVNR